MQGEQEQLIKKIMKGQYTETESMKRTFQQLWVLAWKNLLLQMRHPWVTLIELLIPAFLSAMLLIGRVQVEPTKISNITTWDEFEVGNFSNPNPSWSATAQPVCGGMFKQAPVYLAYTPNSERTTKFMTDLRNILVYPNETGNFFGNSKGIVNRGCWFTGARTFDLLPFDSVSEMDKYMVDGDNSSQVFYGVNFKNDEWKLNTTGVPKKLNYTLRPVSSPRSETDVQGRSGWLTNILYSQRPASNGPTKPDSAFGGKPFYYNDLFLDMQHFIDFIYIYHAAGQENKTFTIDDHELKFERFPYPPYSDDDFIIAINQNLPLVILLSFIYIGQQTAKNVAIEKESRLKEYMLMMGMSRTALWASWFLHYFVLCIFAVILSTIILCAPLAGDYGAILQYSNGGVIFVFLLLWCVSLIMLGFLISTWFASANTTSAMAAILIFVSYLPYGFINQSLDSTPRFIIGIFCLLSPVNMSFGCATIASWEARSVGVQWSNINEPISASDSTSMGRVMIFFIIDTIFYYLLTRYFDLVKSGDWGISLPWYFCFQPSYWCPKKAEVETGKNPSDSLVEELPANHKAGFKVANIIKEFKVKGKAKRAVDELSFTAVQNEITVLLGHNGAGKSTTMNMLTGMLQADKGDCYVGNINVAKEINKARKTIGLCPQHNILIKELTVKEHFLFFAQLKGFSKGQAEKELETLVDEVQLGAKANDLSSALSGGMKRKLSLGIAVCGGSRHLILDEPSSGIDVTARRELWSILEKYRKSATMLISTHYMDEAEALGDRIVIISKGKLKCAGSTTFLKRALGDGYKLTLSLRENCDTEKIDKFIKTKTPEAKQDKVIGSEAEYTLPFESAPKFPELFRAFDSTDIGIDSYGASITTLDEIFMKVTHDEEEEDKNGNDISKDDAIIAEISKKVILLNGLPLFLQQFRGAFIKCLLHAMRNWKIILLQLLTPAIMTTLAVIQILAIPEIGAQPELSLSMRPYKTMNDQNLKTPYNFGNADYAKNLVNLVDKTSESESISTYLGTWLPNQKNEDLTFFDRQYVLAFESNSTVNSTVKSLKTWFNAEAYHAIASAVYYADQMVLDDVVDGYQIETSNHPLPPNRTEALKKNVNFFIQGTVITFNLIIGVMVMFAAFSMLPVRERSTGVRTLQKCSGAPLWLTWLAEYVWDFLNVLPSFAIILIIFAASQSVDGVKVFVDNADLITVLFLMFTLAQLPFTYCLSFSFSQPSSAISYTSLFNIICAMATFLAVLILRVLPQTQDVGKMLNNVFLIFPQFCFAMGLFDLYYNANIVEQCTKNSFTEIACKTEDLVYQTNPWVIEEGGIGRYLLALFILTPAFFGLLSFIEWEVTTNKVQSFFKVLRGVFSTAKPLSSVESVKDEEESDLIDDDVAQMTQKIKSDSSIGMNEDNVLVVNGLEKQYMTKTGPFKAVQGVSFLVRRGECFGLLGPNGAGKTTTFKMLTAEHAISGGGAVIQQLDLATDSLAALRRFGYCPQFDALLDQLTGIETVRMYARLRGVPEQFVDDISDKIIELVGIKIHRDKRVNGYSGGTKRKLSVGIALVGFPPLLMMDEPSCGLDPGARRKLWNVISGAQRAGASVVLTSHSMEECAALCQKLAIMVNGSFKCIGGQQHLKSKFGEGAEVEIQLGGGDAEVVVALAQEAIPGLNLKDQFQGAVKFIAPRSTPLSKIFEELEKLKGEVEIDGYTVNQATLEQIFLTMTKTQRSSDS